MSFCLFAKYTGDAPYLVIPAERRNPHNRPFRKYPAIPHSVRHGDRERKKCGFRLVVVLGL
jgi:hypothetical protein